MAAFPFFWFLDFTFFRFHISNIFWFLDFTFFRFNISNILFKHIHQCLFLWFWLNRFYFCVKIILFREEFVYFLKVILILLFMLKPWLIVWIDRALILVLTVIIFVTRRYSFILCKFLFNRAGYICVERLSTIFINISWILLMTFNKFTYLPPLIELNHQNFARLFCVFLCMVTSMYPLQF
jgi:hypothetical protein